MSFTANQFFKKLYTRIDHETGEIKVAKGLIHLFDLKDNYNKSQFLPSFKYDEMENYTGDYIVNRYYTVNTFSVSEKSRKSQNVISLNAFVIDLDLKKGGIEKEFALNYIAEKSKLEPSAIVDSGNGLHVYFFIDFVYIPKRTNRTESILNLYTSVQKSIINSFKELNADKAVSSISNLIRIPDSINAKGTINKVKILELNDNVYTLSEMAEHYKKGYKAYKKSELNNNKEEKIKKTKGKKESKLDLNTDRVLDILKIVEMRGGKVESRNEFLRLVITLNSSFVYKLNNLFILPENVDKIQNMIEYNKQNKTRKKYLRNDTIIERLNITEKEQQELKTIISSEESKRRDRLYHQKIRQEDVLLNKLEKQIKILYVNKYKYKLTNLKLAEELKLSKDTINRYKKETVTEKMIEDTIAKLIKVNSEFTNKKEFSTAQNLIRTKKDMVCTINFLGKRKELDKVA